jgi:hypothetical protein
MAGTKSRTLPRHRSGTSTAGLVKIAHCGERTGVVSGAAGGSDPMSCGAGSAAPLSSTLEPHFGVSSGLYNAFEAWARDNPDLVVPSTVGFGFP